MRLTRRQVSYVIIAAATVGATGIAEFVLADKPPTVAEAVKFIQQAGDKLAAILNGPGDWSVKRPQVEAQINEMVDVYGVTRFSLGRFWKTATEQQRSECARLYANVLLGSVGRAVGAYRGVTFTIGRATQLEDTVQVWTTVLRPGDQPREVIWVIGSIDGVPKIVDVVAEGTSMRITQRDDTMGFLSHNNYSVSALVDELRRRSAPTS
jgi:phospholipid transport system substrate-binding protein